MPKTAKTNKPSMKIDADYLIPVKNNASGTLYYKSKKTGYEETWAETGDVIEMEYSELVSMRNTQKKFFVNNWILFEDTEDYTAEQIYEALNVKRYYIFDGVYQSIDDVFDFSAKKIEEVVSDLPKPVKETILAKAYSLLAEEDPRLDSNAKRKALEKALNIKFDADEVI